MVTDGEDAPRVHEFQYELDDRRTLTTTVIMAVADVAGVDPSRIREPLYDVIDPDALNDLFEPSWGPAVEGHVSFPIHGYVVTVRMDGTISLRSQLADIKRRGGNLLVVGAVPDQVFDSVSTSLLGEPDLDRRPVFALYDRDVSAAGDRLSMARMPASRAKVVNYAGETRAVAQGSRPDVEPTVTMVAGGVDDFRGAILDTIEEVETEADDLAPAELRLCFDSLRPLVETDSPDARAVLEPICEAVEEVSGMAHYVLPVARDSPTVRSVESLFDVVVEVRTHDGTPEQRWHLTDTGITTAWFSL